MVDKEEGKLPWNEASSTKEWIEHLVTFSLDRLLLNSVRKDYPENWPRADIPHPNTVAAFMSALEAALESEFGLPAKNSAPPQRGHGSRLNALTKDYAKLVRELYDDRVKHGIKMPEPDELVGRLIKEGRKWLSGEQSDLGGFMRDTQLFAESKDYLRWYAEAASRARAGLVAKTSPRSR